MEYGLRKGSISYSQWWVKWWWENQQTIKSGCITCSRRATGNKLSFIFTDSLSQNVVQGFLIFVIVNLTLLILNSDQNEPSLVSPPFLYSSPPPFFPLLVYSSSVSLQKRASISGCQPVMAYQTAVILDTFSSIKDRPGNPLGAKGPKFRQQSQRQILFPTLGVP